MAFVIDIEPASLNATGRSEHIITNADVNSFGVGDDALKNAIDSYFGKRPNDAFLRSPTPWNDLYSTYGWGQVQTVLQVVSSRVLEQSSKPVALRYQNFVNTTSDKQTFSASMSCQKTNSASNTWTNTNTIKVDQKIQYKIKFVADEAGGETALSSGEIGGETDLSYQYTFGQSGTQSTSITITSVSSVTVEVDPHQTRHAILQASQGQKKVRITYMASLIGSTAVNYNPPYKGHHFWDLDIGEVMSSGGISNSKIMTEDMSLDFYSNSSVEVGEGPAPMSVVLSTPE